jgi:hypothetical protein
VEGQVPASRVLLERASDKSSVLAFVYLFCVVERVTPTRGDLQVFSTWLSLLRVNVSLAGALQRNHLVLPGEGDHAGRGPVAPSYHGFRS